MKLHKRLIKSSLVKKTVTFLLTRFIRFVYKTNRWTVKGEEYLHPYVYEGKQAIFVFWHGRLMMMPNFIPRNDTKIYVMISYHGDGDVIADCMAYFDLQLVRGSSRKGGAAAFRRAKEILISEKQSVCITPDGPRGPGMQINSQVVSLAKMTGVPIVPVAYSCSRAKQFKSWDKFLLALPFGRGVLICGEPLSVPENSDKGIVDSLKHELETRLNQITQEADESIGR